MGCIVNNNKREHISRGCGPLEMCRKNSLYSSLILFLVTSGLIAFPNGLLSK